MYLQSYYFAQLLDGIDSLFVPGENLSQNVADLSTTIVTVSGIALIVLVLVSVFVKDRYPRLKLPLFSVIASVMAASTLYLATSTISLNVRSDSGGPVNYRADFETWVCGSEIELRDPTGLLSSIIGTPTLHESDDRQIHFEGAVVDERVDASLGKFFNVIGGAITNEALVIPLNPPDRGLYFEEEVDGDGENPADLQAIERFVVQDQDGPFLRVEDGQSCANSNEESDVQVFVYQLNEDGDTYTQTKLDNPRDYVISSVSDVPPGDCIIFEFGPTQDRTERLCEQYGIRDQARCDAFTSEESLCTLQEVDADGNPIEFVSTTSETSAPADEILTPDQDALVIEDELIALCGQFFNNDGTRNDTDIPAIKSDGTTLDVDTECNDFQQELLGNPVNNTTNEEEN